MRIRIMSSWFLNNKRFNIYTRRSSSEEYGPSAETPLLVMCFSQTQQAAGVTS